MENLKKNYSSDEHKEINSNIYCIECKIYMCHKCQIHHSKLFENHQVINLEKNLEEIFGGYCKEKEHINYKLDFFVELTINYVTLHVYVK